MKSTRILLGICLSVCAAFLVGCASPAQSKAMVARNFTPVSVSHNPVSVQVLGGHKTDPMWTSMVSNEDFKAALVESLRNAQMFGAIEASGNPPYLLKVRLEQLDQPVFGFSFTVNMRADWTLARSSDNSVLWTHKINSSHTATVGDAFAAIKRLRLATEGAARDNIEQGLAGLATVKLAP